MHAVDWYPTLVKLAGAKLEQTLPMDGLDIWPVLTQKAKSPHDAILLCGGQPDKVAIRVGNWKLMPTGGRSRRVELYDLASDLSETKNLARPTGEGQGASGKAWRAARERSPQWCREGGCGGQANKPKRRKQK